MKNKLVRHIKFPLHFDAARLQEEVQRILQYDWVNHYHSSDYDGNWDLLALMSVDGKPTSVLTNDNLQEPLKKTFLLDNSPYLEQLLDDFPFEKTSVRLMRLAVNAYIKPHTDYCLGYEDGVFRLHIPVVTNPEVHFILDNERLNMQPGECWYINANFTHEVVNKGTIDRIHLVIDGIRNDWTDALFFAQAAPESFQKPVQPRDIANLQAMIAELERQGQAGALIEQARLDLQALLERAML